MVTLRTVKRDLFIWILLTTSVLAFDSVISSERTTTQQITTRLNNESGILVQNASIQQIWTEDLRPAKVIVRWQFDSLSTEKNCRIFRLTVSETNGTTSKIITKQITGPIYTFSDTDVADSAATYVYRIIMPDANGNWTASRDVFTLPRPKINRCWDYFDGNQVYLNGKEDTIFVDPASLRFGNDWQADSVRLKWQGSHTEPVLATLPRDQLPFVWEAAETLNDGASINFQVQSVDTMGSISRWSLVKNVIADLAPPEPSGPLQVKPRINAEATKCWLELEWPPATDATTKTTSYSIFRQVGSEGDYLPVIEIPHTPENLFVFSDSSAAVDTSTIVSYRLEAVDPLGNLDNIGTDQTRALKGPTIILPDSVNTDSVWVTCPNFDPTQVNGFRAERKKITESDYTEFQIELENIEFYDDSVKFTVPLDSDLVKYDVRTRAVFNDSGAIYYSTWSLPGQVERRPPIPDPVTGLVVSNQPPLESPNSKAAGNLYLTWKKPQDDPSEFLIYRTPENQTCSLVQRIANETSWIDDQKEQLKIFKAYWYNVRAVNEYNYVSVETTPDSSWCNRAPRLASLPEVVSATVCTLKLNPEWESQLSTEFNKEDIQVQFHFKVDDFEQIVGPFSYSENYPLDLTPYREEMGDAIRIQFRAALVAPDGRVTAWSDTAGTVLDVMPPDTVTEFTVSQEVFADSLSGRILLHWSAPENSLDDLHSFRLTRKTASGSTEQIPFSPEDTTHEDLFEIFEKREEVTYTIEAVDRVGNWSDVCERHIRPLIGPQVEAPETVDSRTVLVQCEAYDITNLIRFEVRCHDDYQQILLENSPVFPIEIPVTLETVDTNLINVRGVFSEDGEERGSTWSDTLAVYCDIQLPGVVENVEITNNPGLWADTSKYKPWDGNIYLKWSKAVNATGYKIWRSESEDDTNAVLVDTISDESDTIYWVDHYDSNEIDEVVSDTLLVFNDYYYGVQAFNLLRETAEISERVGEWCNKAPEVVGSSKNEEGNKWTVLWRIPKYDNARFSFSDFQINMKLFTEDDEQDDEKTVNATESPPSWTVDEAFKYYCILRLIETKLNESTSSWSCPEYCDYGRAKIPPIESLKLQSQPGDSGIFVCYERYWKNEFWENNPRSLIGNFRIIRKHLELPGLTPIKIDTLYKESTDTVFMDNDKNLIVKGLYRYEVQPGQILDNDQIIYKTGNAESDQFHINGRAFIPSVDSNGFVINDKKQVYFRGESNQISIKYSWKKPENKDKAGFLYCMVSNTDEFKQYFDQSFDRSQNTDPEFIFSNLEQLEIKNNLPLFIKITAFDKWENKHDYFSSHWDGVIKVINDSKAPSSADPEDIKCFAFPGFQSHWLHTQLVWEHSDDDESGVKEYIIKRTIKNIDNSNSYVKEKVVSSTNNSCWDTLETIYSDSSYEIDYNIITKDWVGHQTPDTMSSLWSFLPLHVPKSLKISRDEKYPDQILYASWQAVPSNNQFVCYRIEWHQDIDSLGNLRNGMFKKTSETSIKLGPDQTFEDKLYFHVSAYTSEDFQSGWSEIYELSSCSKRLLSGIENEFKNSPKVYYLKQNYPNPFNHSTVFKFGLPRMSQTKIIIFNALGEEINTLINKILVAGNYSVIWDGKSYNDEDVPSGIYFVYFNAMNYVCSKKCLILR